MLVKDTPLKAVDRTWNLVSGKFHCMDEALPKLTNQLEGGCAPSSIPAVAGSTFRRHCGNLPK